MHIQSLCLDPSKPNACLCDESGICESCAMAMRFAEWVAVGVKDGLSYAVAVDDAHCMVDDDRRKFRCQEKRRSMS